MSRSKSNGRPPQLPPQIRRPSEHRASNQLPMIAGIVAGLSVLLLLCLILVLLSLHGGLIAGGGDDKKSGRYSSEGGTFAGDAAKRTSDSESKSDEDAAAPAPAAGHNSPNPGRRQARSSSTTGKDSAPPPPPQLATVRPLAPPPSGGSSETAEDDRSGSPSEAEEFTGTTASGGTGEYFRGGFAGRSKARKRQLLEKFGGSDETEKAVRLGLAWLERNQREDGSWSLIGPYSNGYGREYVGAATSLALLAFQGEGNTHKAGEYKKVVARGWKALSRLQTSSGDFGSTNGYDHALPTLAICELYGMSRDKQLREPAQQAIRYTVEIQDRRRGGWRYTPNTDSDTSVTGWFVMALQSGKMAELDVPAQSLTAVSGYLDAASVNDGSEYAYTPNSGGSISMTAEGLLCRQYLGWPHDDRRLLIGADLIGRHLLNPAL